MAQHVGMELVGSDRWAPTGGGGGVLADEALHGIAAEASTGAGREQRLIRLSAEFGHPDAENGLGGRGERNGSVFAALAKTSDVGAGPEADVAAVQVDQLGQA